MKIFLAGATGAIGKRLVPLLVRNGHAVTGTTRHPDKLELIRSAGATPLLLNALNAKEVLEAVRNVQPEVIIHQLTAIPHKLSLRRFDKEFEATNRLRSAGIEYLLAAGRTVDCRRFIAQSYAGWYARTGGWIKTEEDALMPPAPSVRRTLEATLYLESAVLEDKTIQAFVLRYGTFYGPGTSLSPGGWFLEGIRQRRVPVVGEGTGHWSFIHIDDAAAATLAALEAPTPGVYNVTDDEPSPVSEWLPFLADALGAPAPWHIPYWLARMAIGQYGVAVMTELRGASNRKAKSLLGWEPKWPTWRKGFRNGIGGEAEALSNRDERPTNWKS